MSDTINTLSNFKEKMIGSEEKLNGIVSPARFEIIIHDPTDTRDLVMSCDSAYIPALNFMTREARTYGPLYEVPYAKVFDNLELTFIMDPSFQQRFFFEEWYHSIIDWTSNNARFYSEFVKDIEIRQFDQANNLIYWCTLLSAFPKRLDMIPLSWAAFDEFQKVSVNFVFENIIINTDLLNSTVREYTHNNKTSIFKG